MRENATSMLIGITVNPNIIRLLSTSDIGGVIAPSIKQPLSSSEQSAREGKHVGKCPVTSHTTDKHSWSSRSRHAEDGGEAFRWTVSAATPSAPPAFARTPSHS